MRRFFQLLVIILGICILCNLTVFKEKKEFVITRDFTKLQSSLNNFQAVNDWLLYINGKNVTNDIPVILAKVDSKEWVCVPLLAVVEKLGATITGKNQNEAILEYKGKKLHLNMEKQIICENFSKSNELESPTGGEIYYEFVEGEIISSGSSLIAVCYGLGIKANYVIINNQQIVTIDDTQSDNQSTN